MRLSRNSPSRTWAADPIEAEEGAQAGEQRHLEPVVVLNGWVGRDRQENPKIAGGIFAKRLDRLLAADEHGARGLQAAEAFAHRDLLWREVLVEGRRQRRRGRKARGRRRGRGGGQRRAAIDLLQGRQSRALFADERVNVGVADEQVVELVARGLNPLG